MSRYKPFYSVFKTPVRNEKELKAVLKRMMKLDVDEDDRFLVPALYWLSDAPKKSNRASDRASYASKDYDASFPTNLDGNWSEWIHRKNLLRLIEARGCTRDLRGHTYNVYESAYLESETWKLRIISVFSFCIQTSLFAILVRNHAVKRHTYSGLDETLWITAILTTLYFGKLWLTQAINACAFYNVFSKFGFQTNYLRRVLYASLFINVVMGALVTFFNLFFLLVSEDVDDAILNSVALFFILEMDDNLRPDWDDTKIDDEIAGAVEEYVTRKGISERDEEDNNLPEFLSVIEGQEHILSLLEGQEKSTIKTYPSEEKVCIEWWDEGFKYIIVKVHTEKIKESFCNDIDFFDVLDGYYCVEVEEDKKHKNFPELMWNWLLL